MLEQLKYLEYGGTDTIRENWIAKDCKISCTKTIKTNDRGSFEYVSSYDWIFIKWWRNTAIVAVDSTGHPVFRLESVKSPVKSYNTKSVHVKSDIIQ